MDAVSFWLEWMHILMTRTCSLNENTSMRLMCLETWFPVGGAVWGGNGTSRKRSLTGENMSLDVVLYWALLPVPYPSAFSVCEYPD